MKSTRIAAIALASSLAGGLVATAAGAELFDDVNPEGQFAEHITSVQEAGIASGYGDGTFRPQNKISRQQAASWINRAASRTALDFADAPSEHAPITPADPTQALAHIEVTSPATASGGGWVTLQGYVAAATVATDGAGCPCAVDVKVRNSDGDVVALSAMTVPGPESDDERPYGGPVGITPVTGAVFLPGGVTETYTLEVTLVDADVVSVFVAGTLSGDYAPMAADEDPTTLLPTTSGGDAGPVSLAPGRP